MTLNKRTYSSIGAALLFVCAAARATTFPPLADGDVTGLKNDIAIANTNNQDDTIQLATNGTYVLSARDNALNGLPAIAPDGGHKLTIIGNGATIVRNSGAPTFRIFYVNTGANLTLDSLILSNGSPGAFHGGAIYNDGELGNVTLTVTNCTFTGNSGDYGGAIFNDGYQDPSVGPHTASLTVINSTFSGNVGTQYGGAIWNESGGINMNVSYSTFINNNATARSAGAIQFDGSNGAARGSIANCTFTNNGAANYGGAVNIDGSSGSAILPITDCTFDNNGANWGGAVAMNGSSGNAVVNVTNCTFNDNSANTLGGGIYITQTGGGTTSLSIGNTILTSIYSGADLTIDGGGSINSLGHNICDDNGAGALIGSGDQINTDPMLDAAGLQNNGGPTSTIGLQAGSPAINQGNDAIAPERDQRGYLRNGTSDIGAFELNGLVAPIVAGSNKGTFAVNFPLTGPHGVECRSGGSSGNFQLAMSFASPVTIGSATIQSGVGSVSGLTVTGLQATVSLTGVANAQHLVVRLTNVNDGVHTNNADIPMDMLIGDTNADHFVDAIDTAQTKSKAGQPIDATNFREDVNVDGFIDAIDTALVKSKAGTSLPASKPIPPRRPPVRVFSKTDSSASQK